MFITNQQWDAIAGFFVPKPRLDKRGGERKDPRQVLEGIIWVLKTGAQWNQLPAKYPPYQTCHRWFQRWMEDGTIGSIVTTLAHDLEDRGGISLKECFLDGSFASAKKGALVLDLRSVEKAPKSWQFRTKTLFQSPSLWPLLLRMKSPWWKERLPLDLPERLQTSLWLIGPMTLTRWMPSWRVERSSSSPLTAQIGKAKRRKMAGSSGDM